MRGFSYLDTSFSSTSGEKLEKVLISLMRTNESVTKFRDQYLSWIEERESCINEIQELAEDIDKHHRNISIAQLPTSAVGVTGGVLTITGLALIPVTFGASLGLTISGTVLGAGAAVTGITTSVTDIGIQVDRLKKAKCIINEHAESTDEMSKIIKDLLDNCSEFDELADDEAISALLSWSTGKCTRISLLSLKTVGSTGYNVIKTVLKTVKSLSLLRRGAGITAAASASSLRTVDAAANAATGGAKVVATTAGRVFTGLGYTFSAIGIVVDIASAGVAIYDLAQGSISTTRELRKAAEDLTKEMNFVKKIYAKLN